MVNSGLSRRVALLAGGLAIAGMGFTVGCSSKQAPAPTAPAPNSVDAKLPQGEPDAKPSNAKPSKAQPPVKAKPAPTAQPGNTPGDN